MPLAKNQALKQAKKLVHDLSLSLPIDQAYLFGSYAKGRPTQWSDIDIALVSSKFKGVRFLDIRQLLPFLRGKSNHFELHPFKKKDFNSKDLFVKEILNNGIRIKP